MVLGAVKGRAQAVSSLPAPARHDRGMLVRTKGVPTLSTTPLAGVSRPEKVEQNLDRCGLYHAAAGRLQWVPL
jgi:hypothetical protein